MVLFVLGGMGNLMGQTQPFTTVGTTNWTVPAGVTCITVECWGGGGGGGGGKGSSDGNGYVWGAGGGGGGGGAYSKSQTITVTPGQTITVTVGNAGTAGTNAPGNGGNGGTSSIVVAGVTYQALGGLGGAGRNSTSANGAGNGGLGGAAETNGTLYSIMRKGGNGAAGLASNQNFGGSGGGAGGPTSNGGNAAVSVSNNPSVIGSSGGAPSGAGGQGQKVGSGSTNSTAGNSIGGGGGGAANSFTSTSGTAGKAGAQGEVRITVCVAACTAPTSVALSGFTTPICSGSNPGTLTATATGGSPTTYNYLWYKDGVSTGINSQTYAPGNLTANTTIYCAVSTGSGCSTTSPTTTINITSPPTSISANSNSPICAGSTLNLTGAATGNTSWSWLGPNNFSSTTQNPSIANATPAASGTYFLTASNTCGSGSGLFDDFSDNNFTSNPIWTPQASSGSSGIPTTWTSGVDHLRGADTYSDEIISTPSTQTYGSWKFDFQLVANVNANDAVRFHILSSNASLFNSSGYYVRASAIGNFSGGNGIQLYRIDNGASVPIGFASYTANTSNRTIIVTRSTNNVFRVYLDGSNIPIITTAADGTYTTSSHAGVWTSGNDRFTNHIVDNIVCSSTLVDITVNDPSVAPTTVTGTNSICAGSSTTLTTNNGSLGYEAEDYWYSGACPTECFTQEWSTQPYTTNTSTVNSVSNGILNITSNTNDASINMLTIGTFSTASCRYIQIRYRVLSGGTAGTVQMYYTKNGGGDLSESQNVQGNLISDGNWNILTIDMGASANWTGSITGWRFDYCSASGIIMEIDYITLTSSLYVGTGTSLTVSPASTTTYYTLKKGGCNTTTCASTTVTVVQLPTTSAPGSNQTICQGTAATLAANIPSVGTGAWSVTSGPNLSLTQFSNTASNSSTFTPTTAGTYVLTWTISNSPCAASANTVTITSNAAPTTATVSASSLSICGTLTSTSLGGNTPTTGTGTWSIVSGGTGSFSSINSGTSTFTADAYGTYVLRWTVSNSPCTASTADVTVTFSRQQIIWANLQPPNSGAICSDGNFPVYGQVYIPGVTEGASQGTNVTAQLGYSTTNSDPSTWTTWVNATHNPAVTGNNDEFIGTLSGLSANTYYYAFRYSYNGCAYVYGGYSAPSAASNIWIINTNGGSAFVGNSTTNGGGSTGINSSNNLAFGLFNNSSSTSEAIRNFPALLTGQTVQFDMDNGWVNNGTAVGIGLQNASSQNVWEIFFAGGNAGYSVNGSLLSPTVPFTANGLRVTFTLLTATTYSATIQILNGGATYGPYTGSLLNPGGGQNITRFRAFNFNAGGDGNYNFYFNNIITPSFYDNASTYSSISNGTQSTTSVGGIWNNPTIYNGTLTVTTSPTTANAGSTQTICEGTTATLSANSPSVGTGQWTIVSGGTGTFSDAASPSSTFTPTAAGTYVLRWTISNGSCSSFSEVTINVTSGILNFVNTQFPGNATICFGQTANVYGQVFEPSVTTGTGQGANIEVEVGYNNTNNDPSTWSSSNWVNATYNAALTGNNDEYLGTFGSALSAGTYYYAFRYRLNGCAWQYGGYSVGGGGTWNGTNNINGVLTIYSNTTTSMTPSSICAGVSNIAVTGSNAGSYELFVNGISQGVPSATNSWTIPGPLSAGNQVCVRGYAATNLITMDGLFTEPFWSPALVNSAGGATSGTQNRINALYVKNAFGYLNVGIAGNLVAGQDRKILLFVDSKNNVGHNSLSTWTNRTGVTQNNGLKNLNGGMQFDPGFFADYAITIGVNGAGEGFLDLYDMTTNTNTYLGSTITNPTIISYQANTNATDYSRGYEIKIPVNLFGTITSPIKFFAMLTNNPTDNSATTLSNQFLSPAGNGEGDYGGGAVNFGNAAPNPVSYVLESDCYTQECRTVVAPSTPTFTPIASICSGSPLSALPTTSTNGITGTWSPALNNTATTLYTFTPTAGQCAGSTTLTISIFANPSLIFLSPP